MCSQRAGHWDLSCTWLQTGRYPRYPGDIGVTNSYQLGGCASSHKMMVGDGQGLSVVNCLPKALSNKGFAENVLHVGWDWAGGLLWSLGEDPNQSREDGRAGTMKHQSGAGREDTAKEDIWWLVEWECHRMPDRDQKYQGEIKSWLLPRTKGQGAWLFIWSPLWKSLCRATSPSQIRAFKWKDVQGEWQHLDSSVLER